MSHQLQSLPLFPLEAVLFPQGKLPLRIFEVRYLDMVRKCHAVGAPFGIVRLVKGREVSAAGVEEAFDAVGTLAQIDQLQSVQAGLLAVQCTGQQRFKILNHHRAQFGLWVADVERIDDDQVCAIPAESAHIAQALQAAHSQLQLRANSGLPEPLRFDDAGWVANRWAELLPLQPELKQQLMQLDSPLLRLDLVGDALERLSVIRRRA